MATNNKIQTTELDFDQIKQNLKTYLQGQSQFSDYDFDGSGLSILLDVLAYNTHYNALYTNMAINEAFLDSATKRSSVVSKAKELGYVPLSAKSATAVVDVLMINDQLNAPDTLEIPRYTQFTTSINGKDYMFYTVETYLAYRQGTEYLFQNVVLREGTQLEYRYEITTESSVVIPNAGVDTSTLRVTVQDNAQSSTYQVYSASDSLLDVDATSQVYFIKEIENQLYEVEFGNNLVGKGLVAGNVVTINYIVSSESAPNGARVFKYNGIQNANTLTFITTTTPAYGGSAAEGVDSIKWNAPRAYTAQNRCVTLDDFKTIIYSMYPTAQTINVWGGESNNPPTYGDVYISVKPNDRDSLSDAEKNYILTEVIGPRRLVTMHPKFVDPTYIRVELETSFYYNPKLTNRTAYDITSLVKQAITNYDQTYLNKFGGVLKYSALSRAIDDAENSIQNSITTIKIHREVPVQINQSVQYVVDLGNPIYNSGVPEESILSTGVTTLNTSQVVYIDDVPTEGSDTGKLRLFYYNGGKKVFVRNIGTVIYSKGLITINDLIITGVADNIFEIIIKPQSNDVASIRNQIVYIGNNLVTITPVIDTDANNYSFTSSRN